MSDITGLIHGSHQEMLMGLNTGNFDFLVWWYAELAMEYIIFSFFIGTMLFSGAFSCGQRLKFLGGRPKEIKELEDKTEEEQGQLHQYLGFRMQESLSTRKLRIPSQDPSTRRINQDLCARRMSQDPSSRRMSQDPSTRRMNQDPSTRHMSPSNQDLASTRRMSPYFQDLASTRRMSPSFQDPTTRRMSPSFQDLSSNRRISSSNSRALT